MDEFGDLTEASASAEVERAARRDRTLGWLLLACAALPVGLSGLLIDRALRSQPWGPEDPDLLPAARLVFRLLNIDLPSVLPLALPPLGVLLWLAHRGPHRGPGGNPVGWAPVLRAAVVVGGAATGIAVGLVAVVGYLLLPGTVEFPDGYFDPRPEVLPLLAPQLAAGVMVAVLAGLAACLAFALARRPEGGSSSFLQVQDGASEPTAQEPTASYEVPEPPARTGRSSEEPCSPHSSPLALDSSRDGEDPHRLFRRPG